MIIRAINVRAPWTAFIFGLPPEIRKDIENRGWRLRAADGQPYTGPLAIVASATCTRVEYDQACSWACRFTKTRRDMLPDRRDLELGGLVGVTHVKGYVEPDHGSPYDWHMPDSWGWQLANSVALPFRRVRGRQGPFQLELTPDEVKLANLSAAA